MPRDVIIQAADANYMDHAKALFVNCRLQGTWEGDFALIVPVGTDVSGVVGRGIAILESDGLRHFQKFSIFDPFFRAWERAFYMDCDVLVQDAIAPLFDELDSDKMLIGDVEPWSLFHCFTYWSGQPTYNAAPEGIYDWLWTHYDPRYRQFNTAMLLFRPAAIPEDAVAQLTTMREKIEPINDHVVHGTDQPVFNLVFYKKFSPIRDKLFFYWEHADENTRVVHYCSGYAPWIEKLAGMDAYANPRFGRPCHDIYKDHLAQFPTLFPKVQ